MNMVDKGAIRRLIHKISSTEDVLLLLNLAVKGFLLIFTCVTKFRHDFCIYFPFFLHS